jgi:signal transduction histidine kinase
MCIRARVRAVLMCLLAGLFLVSPLEAAETEVLRFGAGEFIFSNQSEIPATGWIRQAVPFHNFFDVDNKVNIGRKALWGRFRFGSDQIGQKSAALLMDYTPERFIVYLNGAEIFRNYSDPTAHTFASFAPAFVPLPPINVREGSNEIDIRFESDTVWCLGVGEVSLGPEKMIRESYDRQYFLQFLGPQVINGIIAALTVCVLLFWTRRRQEHAFFWLAIVGILWWTRNLHYSAVNPPFGPRLMWESSVYALFGLVVAFFGFTLSFFDAPNRRKWIGFFGAIGFVMIALRFVLHLFGKSDFPSFLFLFPMTLTLVVICARALANRLNVENVVMLVATTLAISFSFHDFGWIGNAWKGMGFQIQPYASLIVYSAFLFTIGRRFLMALGTVENMNVVLEQRVADASMKLRVSEEAQQSLKIERAIEAERERMMLEMHDRIGSGLVTAIAVAERQDYPSEAIATLKNSLLDLRLTVDSLEPVDGDLALLLGAFRHRVEKDLAEAGLRFDWQVERVPALGWLNAVNALHVLRIFQEAVSNILSHAQASVIPCCLPQPNT